MTWSPPQSDLPPEQGILTQPGELEAMRVSDATQTARDRASMALRATYESGGDPTGLGDVEAKIQKTAGGKARDKGKAWSPPAADFTFVPPDDGEPAKAPESANPFLEAVKTANNIASFANPANLLSDEEKKQVLLDTPVARAYRFIASKAKIAGAVNALRTPDEDGVTPIEREIARRKEAGESVEPRDIEQWVDQEAKRKVFGEPPPSPPVTERLKQIYESAINEPAKFAKEFILGSIAHPEYLMMGPFAGVAAIAGESLAEQEAKHGRVDANEFATDMITAGVPVAAFHAAARLGNLRAAKVNGREPTAKVEEQALTAINEGVKEAVSEGRSPEAAAAAALDDVLAVMKIAPEERAAIVKGVEDAISEGQQQKGDSAEPGRAVDSLNKKLADSGVPPERWDGELDQAIGADHDIRTPDGMLDAIDSIRKYAGRLNDISDSVAANRTRNAIAKDDAEEAMRRMREDRNAPPSQSIKINIGNKGSRTIEFPDEADKFVFRLAAAGERRFRASDAERAKIQKTIEGLTPYVKKYLGATSDGMARQLARDYRQRVIDFARLSPEGGSVQAKGAKWNPESGQVDPKLLVAMGITGVGAAYGYWLNKDPAEAVRGALIAGGVAAGGLALHKVGTATGRLFEGLKDARYRIGHLTDDYSGQVRLGEWAGMRLQGALDAMVSQVADRTRILHAYQAGEVSKLSPVEQKYAEVLGKAFEHGAEMSKATGSPIQSLIENYITQFWVRGLNTKESLLENLKRAMDASGQTTPGMSPNTRFAKQRVIPNYKAGIEAGLVPVTLDPSVIVRMYLDNINKSVQNKKLIDALGREKNPLGEQMVVKGDVLESEVRRRAQESMEGLPLNDGAKRMVADVEAIKAPSDYVFINHPQMRNVKVHPDVAAPLKALFDANDANVATRAAYAVSIAAKRGLFSFSLFHAKSLLDAMLGTSPAGWAKVPGALKMLRDGENAGLRDLIHGGLNVVTRPMEADTRAFSNGMRVLEAKLPMVAMPIKGVRWMQEHMDHFLWGVVHPSFKIAAALAAYEKQIMKRPTVPREQVAKEVASYANDIFGGLDWFKIADGVQNKYGRDLALALTSPSGRRFMQIAMLAPDWTVATTRAMAKAIPGVSTPEIAALHRGYVLRSALVYLMVADGLNQAFSGHHLWDNKDPTMVDMGDGRRMQLSKHFMEPVHWLTKPGQQLLNKLGYAVKEPLTQALHTEYLSTTGAPPMENRLTHAIKGMLPIPSTVMAQQGAGPALSGMLGVPIYGKTQEQAIDAAIERALNLRTKRLESDDPAEQAKARKKSQSETSAVAKARVNRQYQKQREEQKRRESR